MIEDKFLKKTWLKFSILFYVMWLCSSQIVIYAVEEVKKSGAIIDKYDLYNYQSYLKSSGVIDFDGWINKFSNLLFALNKLIVQAVDFIIHYFGSYQVIDSLVGVITSTSNEIYNNLLSNLLVFLFLIMTCTLIYTALYQQNIKKSVSQFIVFVLVMGAGVVWLKSSDDIVKGMNNISNDVQSVVITSANSLLNKDKNIQKTSNDLLRDMYFQQTVEKPYLLMNYGTFDKQKIGQERLDKFLTLDASSDDYENGVSKKLDEEEELKNVHVLPVSIYDKFVISFFSPLISIMEAVPFLFVIIIDFFIQILILIYLIVVPFILILALIPAFSDKALKTFLNLVSFFILKIVVGLLIVVLFVVINIVDKVLEGGGSGSDVYIVSAVALLIIYALLYKNRQLFLKLFTIGLLEAKSSVGDNNSRMLDRLLFYQILNKTAGRYQSDNYVDEEEMSEEQSQNKQRKRVYSDIVPSQFEQESNNVEEIELERTPQNEYTKADLFTRNADGSLRYRYDLQSERPNNFYMTDEEEQAFNDAHQEYLELNNLSRRSQYVKANKDKLDMVDGFNTEDVKEPIYQRSIGVTSDLNMGRLNQQLNQVYQDLDLPMETTNDEQIPLEFEQLNSFEQYRLQRHMSQKFEELGINEMLNNLPEEQRQSYLDKLEVPGQLINRTIVLSDDSQNWSYDYQVDNVSEEIKHEQLSDVQFKQDDVKVNRSHVKYLKTLTGYSVSEAREFLETSYQMNDVYDRDFVNEQYDKKADLVDYLKTINVDDIYDRQYDMYDDSLGVDQQDV